MTYIYSRKIEPQINAHAEQNNEANTSVSNTTLTLLQWKWKEWIKQAYKSKHSLTVKSKCEISNETSFL